MTKLDIIWTENPIQYWYSNSKFRQEILSLLGANHKSELPQDTRHLVSQDVVQHYDVVSIDFDEHCKS